MFISDKRRGKWGERQFASLIEALGAQYKDVSEESEYQEKDIDFIVGDCTYEVKTDFAIHKTGNIFIEVSKDSKRGHFPGWWEKTKADVLVWIDAINGIMYLIDSRRLRYYIKDCARIVDFNIDKDTTTHAILLTVTELKEAGVIFDRYFCDKY